MSDVVRQELAPSGIQVTALHVGYMATDMAAHVPPENKIDPALVAAAALDGVEAGDTEVLADQLSRTVKEGLVAAPALD
jgi:NAD(P)-dependent dehydrogenase (short-subunit alcohol dehydrogenase family)